MQLCSATQARGNVRVHSHWCLAVAVAHVRQIRGYAPFTAPSALTRDTSDFSSPLAPRPELPACRTGNMCRVTKGSAYALRAQAATVLRHVALEQLTVCTKLEGQATDDPKAQKSLDLGSVNSKPWAFGSAEQWRQSRPLMSLRSSGQPTRCAGCISHFDIGMSVPDAQNAEPVRAEAPEISGA